MREESLNWWKQAEHDLKVAEYNSKGGFLGAAAFYCQQAVEKALKALYIEKKRESPLPTHSLTRLARECELPSQFMGTLRRLTSEYYLSRYPDATEDVPFMTYDREGVGEYIKEAKEAMEWISTELKKPKKL